MRFTDDSTIELDSIRPSNGELAARPSTGELTGQQGMQGTSIGGIAGGVMTFANALDGFGKAPPPSVHTYRMMRNNANVAIARMAIQAPVKAAKWTIQEDDGAPAGAADLIQSVVDHQTAILEHALRMLDYGRSSFELVWSAESGAIVPDKFKPLLVDLTTINVDREHGAYAGLTNGRAKLLPENTLHFSFDGEAGDYYGRSLFENIRQQAWWPWLQTLKRAGQFGQKVAGPTLMVRYVPGKGVGSTGAARDNFDMAVEVAQAFGRGDAVVIPMTFAPWAEDLIRQGVDPAKLLAWQVDLMEPGTGHAAEFIQTIRMFEASILRGLMVPERVVTEGKFGTKAESESQAEIAIAFSQEVLTQIVDCLNWYVVDRIMRLNFGEKSVGTVYLIAESLIDEKRALIREMVKGLLGNAANVDVWQTLTDVEAQLELMGIPVSRTGKVNTMAEELAKAMRGELGTTPAAPVEPVEVSMDCGTGAGGFQPGNSCAVEGDGGANASNKIPDGADVSGMKRAASMSFDDYATAVNPDDVESDGSNVSSVSKEYSTFSGMDAEELGAYPEVATVTKHGDTISIRKMGDREFVAFKDGDPVGYVRGDGKLGTRQEQISLDVEAKYNGYGIGTELSFQLRARYPFHGSGGLSSGGRAVLKAVHRRMKELS